MSDTPPVSSSIAGAGGGRSGGGGGGIGSGSVGNGGIPLNLRPVIFAVNATLPPSNRFASGGGRGGRRHRRDDDDDDDDEPFDERNTSTTPRKVTATTASNSSTAAANNVGEKKDPDGSYSYANDEDYSSGGMDPDGNYGNYGNANGADDDDDDNDANNAFDAFLSALQGRPSNSHTNYYDNEEASYASSAPFSPERKSSASIGGGGNNNNEGDDTTSLVTMTMMLSSSSPSPIRKSSPFARLKRWRNTPRSNKSGGLTSPSPGQGQGQSDGEEPLTALESTTHSLAEDIMEEDAMDDNATDNNYSSPLDNHYCGGSNNSNNNNEPTANFLSKKALTITVSHRHAFPPSKCPNGKLDDIGFHQQSSNTTTNTATTSWIQSYDLASEGVLPSGWLEKHARALPSGVLVVGFLEEGGMSDFVAGGVDGGDGSKGGSNSQRHVVQAVEDLRMTLADKRMVPIHVVYLVKSTPPAPTGQQQQQRQQQQQQQGMDSKTKQQFNAFKEKLSQECHLPQNQVSILRYPMDLEPDQWEAKIARSPYLPGAPPMPGSDNYVNEATTTTTSASANATLTPPPTILNPHLRSLDRTLRDSSALYYSRLADHQEKKLVLWRNRYHSTNPSFVVNTTIAAMRCARYALKAATLRELQMRTGGRSSWASVAGGGVGSVVGGTGNTIDGSGSVSGGGSALRWTDKGSIVMRHYEESYRWVIELHRRAISWRAAPVGNDVSTPMTPGNNFGGEESSSEPMSMPPRFTESPGGGIGVELSFPTSPGANESFRRPSTPGSPRGGPTPTPPQVGDRAMQRRNSSQFSQNGPFFSQLWEQCRAVASIINAKLLRSASTSSAIEAEDQWRRHRLIFLASPQNVPGFHSGKNDDFFGPAWHRVAYATGELSTFACIAEGRWRRAAMHSSKRNLTPVLSLMPSYHQPLAPWRVYGELAEAMLRLGREVTVEGDYQKQMKMDSAIEDVALGRRKYVGSIVSGESGVGTMQWMFDNETLRDHRAMALEYVLHALDILKENDSLCPKSDGSDEGASVHVYSPPDSSARLHFLAGRLLISSDKPSDALSYLKTASSLTKKWPSLNVEIQRALAACADRCKKKDLMPYDNALLKDASVEMLLRPDMCKLLSANEKSTAQRKAWEAEAAAGTQSATKEAIWTDDENGEAKAPFEFTVSFTESTHATSSGKVTACVSVKSCLDFPVCVESLQLMTTSGPYDVANLDQCTDGSFIQSREEEKTAPSTARYIPGHGVQFNPGEVVFLLTELMLPSDLSAIALGKSSVDLSKFIPKSGKLCNMGYTHAAGNICKSRFENERQPITLTGKPVTLSSLDENSHLFLGGVPLVCHGLSLSLKPVGSVSNSSVRLTINRQHVISPLGRSGTQRLMMEESNYLGHSWSRSSFHPWCLGPQCLRVHGPRPLLEVTNLSEKPTNGNVIRGTVNRLVFKLQAGGDQECRDVRVWLRCNSGKGTPVNDNPGDTKVQDVSNTIDPHLTPLFVQRTSDHSSSFTTESGTELPKGWEPRRDVATEESNETSTLITSHLKAGKSTVFSLDLFCPLSQTPISAESSADTGIFSTSYEVIIEYKQTRGRKDESAETGDHVMVMHNGSLTWVPPFSAEFFLTNGPQKPFPGGYQHQSNTLTKSALKNASDQFEMIAADGEQVRMRCVLEGKGFGTHSAAKIASVTDESKSGPVELYSGVENSFMDKLNQGSKLSLSYSFCADRTTQHSNESVKIPLGTVCVNWKPNSLTLSSNDSDSNGFESQLSDEFGLAHGPLNIPDVAPIRFHGPLCHVLNVPFFAQLKDCPTAPKVGTPFRLTYLITNRTAKSQTLTVAMNTSRPDDGPYLSDPKLLVTGKMKGELQIAPFEKQSISFTFMSMVAGKVLRPPLTVSSSRHQSWVINENESNSRYLFVMP